LGGLVGFLSAPAKHLVVVRKPVELTPRAALDQRQRRPGLEQLALVELCDLHVEVEGGLDVHTHLDDHSEQTE
jgi:hypothetical protein